MAPDKIATYRGADREKLLLEGARKEGKVVFLGIDGVFFTGKQGEFFSMSVAERKRTFDIGIYLAR